MYLSASPLVVLAAQLEARGFLAGIGKTIVFFIIVLVVIGVFIGFLMGKRRRG